MVTTNGKFSEISRSQNFEEINCIHFTHHHHHYRRFSWTILCSFLLLMVTLNIPSYIDSLLAKTQATTKNTCHEPLPPLPLFDNTLLRPIPTPPSSYFAVIQLYVRSGQLVTAHHLSSRRKDSYQPWCRFGCQHIEVCHFNQSSGRTPLSRSSPIEMPMTSGRPTCYQKHVAPQKALRGSTSTRMHLYHKIPGTFLDWKDVA